MTVMACDKCDRAFIIDKGAALPPCPKCSGQTRWATRQEVVEHLRRPAKNGEVDDLHVPMPRVDEELWVRSVMVREAAKEACGTTRETRGRSQRLREARKR